MISLNEPSATGHANRPETPSVTTAYFTIPPNRLLLQLIRTSDSSAATESIPPAKAWLRE